ncbi:acetylornithine deacetylase [Candidatus Pelagibacter sp.]|nr:acetylornithine deacetylase [Candidatus Pelagibacter sp.]
MSEKNSIEILKKLVSFDTTSFKSNLDLIKFIENYLNDLNIKSELIYDENKNKANLFTTIGPNLQGGIVLSGHTDVVPITKQNWTSDPFILTERDDKLFGRGSSDMKGFIAIVLSRVSAMVAKKLKKPIHLAFSYDEEIGCVGVHSLLDLIKKKSINPEFCIVGEPTSMEMVIGHKGKHAYDVKVDGLSCHSGQAPNGVNAINYASKLINYIEEINKEKSIKGPFDNDYEIPYSTLHTGLIKGGTILNIVPKLCQFEFEIRHLAEDDPLEIIQRIKQYTEELLIKEMHNISSTTNIEINEKINYPGLNISESISPVKQVKELLGKSSHKKVVFGTEGGLFKRELNLPTIICGPGSIDQAHKPDEFISIQQIEKGGTFIDKLINNCS